jgi:GH25 family lysozyme M1 (1,4-beta-N-acetylmuramidase)
MRGIDVSNDNGLVDWQKVKAGGKAFAMAKASQGLDFTDGDYARNRAGCHDHGLLFGAYHFAGDSRTGVLAGATVEADRFLALANPRPGDFPYALDMEPPAPLETNWALKFLDHVKDQIGGRGLLYSSLSNLEAMKAQAPVAFARIVSRHGLWVGAWGDTPPTALPFVLWQYRGGASGGIPAGSCPGVSGPCDLDELGAIRLAPYIVPQRPVVRYHVTYHTRAGAKRELDLKPGPLGGVGFQFARHHLGRDAAHGRIIIDPIRRD